MTKQSSLVIREAVLRSAPSTTRPRLRSESERRLAEVEVRSAACYADAENTAARLREFAEGLQTDGVPLEPADLDDSSVHHLEDLHITAISALPAAIKKS